MTPEMKKKYEEELAAKIAEYEDRKGLEHIDYFDNNENARGSSASTETVHKKDKVNASHNDTASDKLFIKILDFFTSLDYYIPMALKKTEKLRDVLRSEAGFLMCIALTILCITPFIIMFVNATKSAYELSAAAGGFWGNFIPSKFFKENLNHLLTADVVGFKIERAFLNSIIVAATSTILSVYISALTAYGFSVYTFKGKNILFPLILAFMMIPPQISVVAFYDLMQTIGWSSGWKSFLSLIIPAGVAPATIFFLRQYMKSVLSLEMIEAARIDGCSEMRIFNTVALPILRPGIAVMAIFAVVASWNNLFLPMVLLSGEWRTVPVYVSLLSGSRHQIEKGAIFLGLSLTALPLLMFYLILSKHIISGVTLGSLKE
ncbi:MAG: carbohydrate ABC transporter permease [Oscillospiraceae bacterium]|nr:carbohydrate ABC transporter permease [Oscillospiraceae bacterium]